MVAQFQSLQAYFPNSAKPVGPIDSGVTGLWISFLPFWSSIYVFFLGEGETAWGSWVRICVGTSFLVFITLFFLLFFFGKDSTRPVLKRTTTCDDSRSNSLYRSGMIWVGPQYENTRSTDVVSISALEALQPAEYPQSDIFHWFLYIQCNIEQHCLGGGSGLQSSNYLRSRVAASHAVRFALTSNPK